MLENWSWIRAQAELLCTMVNPCPVVTWAVSTCAARPDGSDIAVPYIMQRQDDGSEIPVFLKHTGNSTTINSTETNSGRRKRGATSYRHLLWPNGTVVYSIGPEYTGKH